MVSIETVVLISRKNCCGERTKNVEIRLANELPPKPGNQMFSGGELLGTFKGPGTDGQRIEIQSSPGWEEKTGFYLIIQMDMGSQAEYLNLNEVFAYGVPAQRLLPATAFMSSVYIPVNGADFSAGKCIDGVTNGPIEDVCHTKREKAPWFAIKFGNEETVSIETMILFSRADSGFRRTKGVKIHLANELPQSSEQLFTGGDLLGTFEGPATEAGQRIVIPSTSGWENKKGHYLIVQMDATTRAEYLNLKEVFVYGSTNKYPTGSGEKLAPSESFMSSVQSPLTYSANKCIDGNTDGPKEDMCHTQAERAPWLAISFGEQRMVSIETVVLFNRIHGTPSAWERTKNIEVRLANELPPKPTTGMFTGGVLLGTYKGPAGKGEIVEIRSSPGWEKKRGRNLIIQIDMDSANDRLNLKEVFAYGHSHLHTSGTVAFVKIKETSIFRSARTSCRTFDSPAVHPSRANFS